MSLPFTGKMVPPPDIACSPLYIRQDIPGRKGFSLVEVTLAIGIISLCLLTLLGLMPTGLSAMSEAARETAEAQIVQSITSEAVLTPYAKLTDFVQGSPYYYDEAGLRIGNTQSNIKFEVRLRQVSTTYPGSDQAGNLPNSITTVVITVQPTGYGREKSYVVNVSNSKG